MIITRADERRREKRIEKARQYGDSGFDSTGINGGLVTMPDRSRYMPHVGAKQKAKAAARLAKERGRLREPQPNDDGASD